MKKKITSRLIGALLVLLAFAFPPESALAEGTKDDQTTGRAKLTSEESLRMAEALKKLVNRSTEGLTQVRHSDGSVSMDLQGRFQNVTLAKKEANGTISQSCVDNPKAAAAFFGIDPRLLDSAKTGPVSENKPGSKQSEQH